MRVHPNTVRLYESLGFIAKPGRRENNYRVFTLHLLQMRLARIALPGPYPVYRKRVQQIIKEFVLGNLKESLTLAREYLDSDDGDLFYVTDRFIQFLQNHEKRAQSLVLLIEDYMNW